MDKGRIVRAWKDEEFRSHLSESERRALPPHPAGLIELTDEMMEQVVGGYSCLLTSCNSYEDQNKLSL
jgi:mersacidin/lichenicidin family type 2 lantibiotic